jgi:hypothetical protein
MSNTTISENFKPMSMDSITSLSSIDSGLNNTVSSTSSQSSSLWEYIQSISFTTWLIIFLVLTLLGVNIFAYLAKSTQSINNIFGPIFQKLLITLGMAASQTVDVAASGAKAVVNTTANVTNAGLTNVQNILPTSNSSPDVSQNNAINRAINTNKASASETSGYQEDDATSNIQMGAGKSGYCYIGEDRGYRSCAYVSETDKCISGEIFPSNEICVNPNLRV